MNFFCRTLASGALLMVGLSPTVHAQENIGVVTGTVIDYANQPISDVLVFVDGGISPVVTGAVGAFRLEVDRQSEHVLNFRKSGFAPRTFRLPTPQGDEERQDVGVIQLEPGLAPIGTVAGRVVEAVGGTPLAGALVSVNGNTIAVTSADGIFNVPRVPLAWGPNQLHVRHLSYADVTDDIWVANTEDVLAYDVVLIPVPVAVPEVVVEVDRTLMVYGRMRPFYERRNRGMGDFLTRQEIEDRNPRELTDVFRGIPGIALYPIGLTGVRIDFQRGARGLRERCSNPAIYLDGVLVQGGIYINQLVSPEVIAGIEIYQGVAEIPIEFVQNRETCGVIVIWTR